MTTQSNTQLPEYEYVPIGEYTLVRINTFLRTETFVDEETKSESILYVYEVLGVNPEITKSSLFSPALLMVIPVTQVLEPSGLYSI